MGNVDNKVQKNIYDSEKLIEWGGWLNEFLWICAGADRKVLRQCPTDYAKYAGIGGTILFTALMAMISGGYALYTVFNSQFLGTIFGIFWGLLIFNLDRFIVNTMYSDGEVTISKQELICGMPRIIMAVFLGVVISTPLEMKIFEDAIAIRLEQKKDDLLKEKISDTVAIRDSLERKKEDLQFGITRISIGADEANHTEEQINRLSSEMRNIENDLIQKRNYRTTIQNKINRVNSDLNNTTDSDLEYQNLQEQLSRLINQRRGIDSEINSLVAKRNVIQSNLASADHELGTIIKDRNGRTNNEIRRISSDIDSLNGIINIASIRHEDWTKDMIRENGSFRDKLDMEYKGFQARYSSFSDLKNEDVSTAITSLFIMLLFIIIETAPTFFKMMIASGPYDDLLRAEMHRVRVLSDKRISDINDEVNTYVQISVEKNKQRLDAELAANSAIMEKIAQAQSELLETAIEKWKQEELEKINQNPSAYIVSSSNNEMVKS